MMMMMDSYIIKEPFYTLFVLIAAILGLIGIVLLILGLKDHGVSESIDSKSSSSQTVCNHNDQSGNYCSKCGTGLFNGATPKTNADTQAIVVRQSLCNHYGQKALYCSKCGAFLKS